MSWIAWNTALAALLAVAVAAACAVFRPRPAVAHVLWLLVLVRLVFPPVGPWEITAPAARRQARDLADDAGPRAAGAEAKLSAPHSPSGSPLEHAPGPGAGATSATAATAATAATLPRSPAAPPAVPRAGGGSLDASLLLWPWGLGSAVAAACALAGARRLRRLRRARPAPAGLRAELRALAGRLGVRLPAVLVDEGATSPFVCSLVGVRLVLPPDLASMPAPARRALLTHELAHLRRGDHWVARLEALLAVALWWHPLFWVARGRMREQAELACDAWALTAAPTARLAYAGALIDSLELATDSPAAPLSVLAARPGARAAFERRLKMILNENVPCRVSRLALVPLCALALAVAAAPSLAQEKQAQEKQQKSRDRAAIEVKVNGKDLTELSPAERRALLEALQQEDEGQGEETAETEAEAEPEPEARVKTKVKTKAKAKPKLKLENKLEPMMDLHLEPTDMQMDAMDVHIEPIEVRALVSQALKDVRVEVLDDPDLQELGIAEDVAQLVDSIGDGEQFQENLQGVIAKAMRGAAKMAGEEIRADEDLEKLGLADGVAKLVESLADNEELCAALQDVAGQAMRGALEEARTEIRADKDLRQLGLTGDVESLVESLLGGGEGSRDFDRALGNLMQKGMRAAMQKAQAGGEDDDQAEDEGAGDDEEDEEGEAATPPKAPKKSKSAAKKRSMQ